MPTKSRSIPYFTGVAQQWLVSGGVKSYFDFPIDLAGLQTIVTFPHRWPPKKGDSQDIGGGFKSQKVELFQTLQRVVVQTPTGNRGYSGPIFAWWRVERATAADFIAPSSDNALDVLGTKGISRAIPTNPLSGMGQFLGELRDLPKVPDWKILKDKAHSIQSLARRSAGEYLNQTFGWVPAVKDTIDFVSVAAKAAKHVAQYERNSGRDVRRRSTILEESSTVVTDLGTSYGVPTLPTQLYSAPGKLTRTVTTTRKVWFSGAFTYYLPPVKGGIGNIAKRGEALASKLYGLRATPHLLWQLTPWSWAVDWVVSTGDVLHNWSAFQNDGLVMRYGYVMETKVVTTTYSLENLRLIDGQVLNRQQSQVVTTKTRRRATPYGFGLNPLTFSSRQWAIIAALGISKSPRSLIF